MIRINVLYDMFNSMYNTHQNGFYRPQDFVTAVIAVSLELFNKMGGELPRRQKYADLMAPFYKTANVAVSERITGDIAEKPADFQYYSDAGMLLNNGTIVADAASEFYKDGQLISGQDLEDFFPVTTEYKKVPVALVPANKWNSMTTHVTRGASMQNPKIKRGEEGFEVLPKGIGIISIGYYRLPQEPVYKYGERVEGPDTFLEFQEEGSVHLEWSSALIPAFLYKLGQYYNLTLKDELRLQVQAIDKDLI